MSTPLVKPGASAPLGATMHPGGVNFSVYVMIPAPTP